MALFISLGPFFILCLLFDQTKALFQRWLFYGIATMISVAVLTVMTTISIDLLFAVGGAFWATDLIPGMTKTNESMMSLALQQGGLGMILSALIITAPPMAGAFFNGVLGQYYGANSFTGDGLKSQQSGGGSNAGGAYPPGTYAGQVQNQQAQQQQQNNRVYTPGQDMSRPG
ncbi:type IV secretion system protein [Lysobacter enzymogenes]|uniref:type IV secretion system protein n=1 Tax=Lysobacter enzymogenes TaxID=69 RepID=UPI0038508D92